MKHTLVLAALALLLGAPLAAQDRSGSAHRFNDTAVQRSKSTTNLETRSVTYSIDGKETTRYFETTRNDKGTVIFNEVDRPGGKRITFTGQILKSGSSAPLTARSRPLAESTDTTPYDWCMSAFGYSRVNAPTESAATLSVSTVEVIRPSVSKHTAAMVLGPDGEAYQAADATTEPKATASVEGPNGEKVRVVESWTQNERGWQKKVELDARPKPTPAKQAAESKPTAAEDKGPVAPTPTKSPFLEIPKRP